MIKHLQNLFYEPLFKLICLIILNQQKQVINFLLGKCNISSHQNILIKSKIKLIMSYFFFLF